MYKNHFLTVGFLLGLWLIQFSNASSGSSDVKEIQTDIIALIKSNQTELAAGSIDKLIADHSQSSDLPEALYWIARTYGWSDKYEEEKKVYQKLIQSWPNNFYSDKAKLGFQRAQILSLISSQKFNEAQAAFDKLAVNFLNHPDLPDALYWIAQRYGFAGKREEERAIYQQIIQKYPNSSVFGRAKLGYAGMEVRSLIASQNYDQAKEMLDKLIMDFNGYEELPDVLYRIAHGYTWWGRYEEANSIYQLIIQNYPNSSVSNRAGLGCAGAEVRTFIAMRDYDKAKEFSDKLISDFNGNPDLGEVLYDIAWGYQWSDKDEQAKNFYEQAQRHSTNSAQKDNARLGVLRMNICSLIASNQMQSAQAKIDKMITDFGNHSDLPSTLGFIGQRFERCNKYKDANDMYGYIIQNWPDDSYVKTAEFGLERVKITSIAVSADLLEPAEPNESNLPAVLTSAVLENVEAVAEANELLDKLIIDFNENPDLPQAMLSIVVKCYKQANYQNRNGSYDKAEAGFQRTRTLCKTIVEKFPESTTQSDIQEIYLYIAYCDYQLGQYAQAVATCQKFVKEWTDFPNAHYAQLLIASSYKKLAESGAITMAQAEPQIEQALKAVLEKENIDDKSIARAAIGLGELNFQRKQWGKAAKYFELFLEKRSYRSRVEQAAFNLGQCYEELKEWELAADVFYDFILNPDKTNNMKIEGVNARLKKLETLGY